MSLDLFNISSGGGAGIPAGVTAEITAVTAKKHTTGQGNEVCGVFATMKHVNGDKKGEEGEVLLSAGPLEKFTPSKDGQKIEGDVPINEQSNFGRFVKSALECGWPEDKRDASTLTSMLVGLTFVAGEFIKKAEGTYKEQRLLTCEKVIKWPGEKSTKGAKGESKSAKGESKSDGGDIEKAARKMLTSIVNELDEVKLVKLRNPVKAYAAEHDLDASELLALVLDEDGWLKKNLAKIDLQLADGVIKAAD